MINYLEFHRTISWHKKDLNKILHADPDGCYVYYLVPYLNLQKIYSSGGIKPRNQANPTIDISAKAIQKWRRRQIQVSNGVKTRTVAIHDCVNVFLNPLNNTYYQFRRNALKSSASQSELSSLVCILEVDLKQLAQLEHPYWNVFDHNLAEANLDHQNGFEQFQQYDWKSIYQVKNTSGYPKKKQRASELILFLGETLHHGMIPIKYINRVLAYKGDLKEVSYKVSNQDGPKIHWFKNGTANNSSLEDVMNYELDWVDSLSKIVRLIPADVFGAALLHLKDVECEIGLKLKDSFLITAMSYSGYHGMSHVIRVMFWVLYLAGICNKLGYQVVDEEISAALYAAFIHDLCRTNNGIDVYHGKNAALKYQSRINRILPESMAKRCLKAVEYHSLNNPPDVIDIITQLLMDADAIDRGRFDPPDQLEGCRSSLLRLRVLKENSSLRNSIVWSGYRLSGVTRYIQWSENPCHDYVHTLIGALRMVSNGRSATSDEKQTAYRLLEVVDSHEKS